MWILYINIITHWIYPTSFLFPVQRIKASTKSKAEYEAKIIIKQQAINAVKNKSECFTYIFKEN